MIALGIINRTGSHAFQIYLQISKEYHTVSGGGEEIWRPRERELRYNAPKVYVVSHGSNVYYL